MSKEILITRGQIVIVDEQDYEELSKYKWYLIDGFAARTIKKDDKRTTIYMHRVIMDAPMGVSVYHINHNKLDNQRKNLRLVKGSARMHRRPSVKHSSKYRGVYWCKDKRKWIAEIKVYKKQIRLGRFEVEKDAAIAYDEAARKYYGSLARTNFTTNNIEVKQEPSREINREY
ncbi:MAG: AP2 domain-containing protein [Trichodesmium sp. St2_bin2_1]|nr:AP2 domain-containing protein [Trichodesmium sp. St2_bin2_1]